MNFEQLQTLKSLRSQEWPVTSYQHVSWDNLFFLTAYQPGQTFLMMADGQGLVVDRSVKEVVNEFAKVNQVWALDTKCFYCDYPRRPIAYVDGRHALVPSQGIKDENVVYYMSNFMVHHHFDRRLGGMLLCFQTSEQGHTIKLLLDVSPKSFDGILQIVDQIAAQQELILCQTLVWLGLAARGSWHEYKHQNEVFLAWQRHWAKMLLIDFCNRMYGDPSEDDCAKYIKYYFQQPYRI